MHRILLEPKKGASNKTPRQINRNLVFNLVRQQQPISRADLARVSGLQRSTISIIVEDLIADRWLLEGATGRPPRGRRPKFLQLNDQRAVIALDIHPAHANIAVADIGGKIVTQNLLEIPDDADRVVEMLIQGIKRMLAVHKQKSIDGIGICVPGRAHRTDAETIFAPNLRWPVAHLKDRISEATGLRVELDNVANACALAEVWFGDSDGERDLVVVNVSEGIGTGIFANGRLLRGENGMAGEFGHVQISESGPLCSCGHQGCWEMLASNRTALHYYREQVPGSDPISIESLLRMAQSGDKAATSAMNKVATYLGRGLRMISSVLAPSEIVIVGAITASWHTYGSIVEKELRLNSVVRGPILRPTYDGNTARLRGAVALVLSSGTI